MFDRSSTFGAALDDTAARAVLESFLPGIAASPMAGQFRDARLGQLVSFSPALQEDDAEQARFWSALAEVPPNADAVVDLPGREPVVVGSGRHEWRFVEPSDAASRRPFDLDSPSAAIIDDPERAEAVRTGTVWAEGRSLRQALMFSPPDVLADVERALARLD